MTSHSERPALLTRIRELVAELNAQFEQNDATDHIEVDGVRIETPFILDDSDLEGLPTEALVEIEATLRRLAEFRDYAQKREFRLQMEHLAFAEFLQTRQGTHLPDFDRLYREREEQDRRLIQDEKEGHDTGAGT